MAEREIVNGINAVTGRYLVTPADRELPNLLQNAPLDPARLRELRWWTERYGINDPDRAPIRDVDAGRLDSAGWAVVFGPDVTPEIEAALQPLLKRRQEQAGPLYKPFHFQPGQSKQDFLAAAHAGPGPADPKHVPYYVLLVGDPQKIPFRFQYELDIQYAVGRLHFETTEGYANYARGVVEAETSPAARRPREVAFFGVSNQDDQATLRSARDLVEPLSKALEEDPKRKWPIHRVMRDEAVKARLGRLLGGEETPALLFTATHGVAFPAGDPLQLAGQGALLCQDWPGPEKWKEAIPANQYFSAADVPDDADVRGLVAFFFACYGAGTPDISDFYDPTQDQPEQIAPKPFVSRLSQRLLGHPRGGALAVLGHIDRAWTTSFSWSDQAQTQVFEDTLKILLDGMPVGAATEVINQRCAELSVEANGLWGDWRNSFSFNPDLLARVWKASNDARNFVVIGDPAVRLAPKE